MQACAGFAGVGAVVWAANVGKSTFDDWLRQRQMERRIAAADRVMTVAYKATRAFEAIRNSGAFWAESAAAIKRLKETEPAFESWPEDKQSRHEAAQIVLDRLRANNALWNELFESLPAAKAYFGQETEQALESIWTAHAMLLASANTYARTESSSEANVRAFEALFGGGVDDQIDKNLTSSVAHLEKYVLPIIAGEDRETRPPVHHTG